MLAALVVPLDTLVGPWPEQATASLAVPGAAFPSSPTVAEALAWARGRPGRPAVAVVSSDGSVRGVRMRRQYPAYSLSKVMLLVAYLRAHPDAPPSMRRTLEAMIVRSDNAAADLVYARVGRGAGLGAFAEKVGMTRFTAGASWMDARVTAEDQAVFFFTLDRWVPRSERDYVHALLGSVTPGQRWGIPAAAEPLGWSVCFKGGWSVGNTYMTQAATLQRHGRRFAVAILTEGNPDWTSGFATLKGVAGLLLGAQLTDDYLVQVL